MSLRDRKRARTRQALVDAAADLFERNGYDETTIADIAAAAEIGTRTFFSYFASKEELLFPEADNRLAAAIDAIAERGPDDGPADVLRAALRRVGQGGGVIDPQAALRLRLIRTVPAVRGRALQIQWEIQAEIARRLAAAFAGVVTEVEAAALTGAFVGAITGALQVLMADEKQPEDPVAVQALIERATDVALAPWRRS